MSNQFENFKDDALFQTFEYEYSEHVCHVSQIQIMPPHILHLCRMKMEIFFFKALIVGTGGP